MKTHRIAFLLRIGCQGCLGLVLMSGLVQADAVSDFNVAVEFYKQSRWNLAADACADFVRKYPGHEQVPVARLYWGQALVHQSQFKQAREQFALFLDAAGDHPDRPLALYRMGECSYFLNDYAAARTDLLRFLKQYPDHTLAEWGLVYLGESQLRLKEYEAAIESFQRSIQKFPKGQLLDDARFGLASTFEAMGRTQDALAQYAKIAAITESPRAAEAQFNIGKRYFEEKRYENSAQAFGELVKKFPQNQLVPLAQLNAGYSLYHLQKFGEAIERFRDAAADGAQYSQAQYWIGLSQKSMRDYAAASRTFAASLEATPDQKLAETMTFQWGDSEFRQGHYAKAIELFQRVQQKWPQSDSADNALHSACESALQSGNLNLASQLDQQFTQSYPKSGLRLIQEVLHGRILIAKADAAAGNAVESQRLNEQAAQILRQALQNSTIGQTQRSARYQLARAYRRLNRTDEMIVELNTLLTDENVSTTELLEGLLMRADGQLLKGNNPTALADYQRAFKTATEAEMQMDALAGIANACLGMKNWNILEETLGRLDQLDTADLKLTRAAVGAGDAAYEAKQWDAAEKFFRRATNRKMQGQRSLSALSGLAHTRYQQKGYKDAAELFLKLKAAPANDPEFQSHAAYMYGLCLQQAGDLDASLAAFQQAAQAFSAASKTTPRPEDLAAARNAFQSAACRSSSRERFETAGSCGKTL